MYLRTLYEKSNDSDAVYYHKLLYIFDTIINSIVFIKINSIKAKQFP